MPNQSMKSGILKKSRQYRLLFLISILANMDFVVPWDRGTNYAVELGQRAAECLLRESRFENALKICLTSTLLT